ASLLWVGWFGFNAGSAGAADGRAGMAMAATQIATAAAALSWMFAEWIVIGLVAGTACFFAATSLKSWLGYDDSLDAFGVHGVGGIIGALLTGVFASKEISGADGSMFGNAGQVLIQVEGIAVTIIWTAVLSWLILMVTKALVGLRPSEQE